MPVRCLSRSTYGRELQALPGKLKFDAEVEIKKHQGACARKLPAPFVNLAECKRKQGRINAV
jgi:hypothetical protein